MNTQMGMGTLGKGHMLRKIILAIPDLVASKDIAH